MKFGGKEISELTFAGKKIFKVKEEKTRQYYEILLNAYGDDLDELQKIALYNTASEMVKNNLNEYEVRDIIKKSKN